MTVHVARTNQRMRDDFFNSTSWRGLDRVEFARLIHSVILKATKYLGMSKPEKLLVALLRYGELIKN